MFLLQIILLTSVRDYIVKLSSMGIPAATENFFTSSQATVMHINNNYPGELVYCMVTNSFL